MSEKKLRINVSFRQDEKELYDYIKSKGRSSDFLKKIALEFKENEGKEPEKTQEKDLISALTQAFYSLANTENRINNQNIQNKQSKNEELIKGLDL